MAELCYETVFDTVNRTLSFKVHPRLTVIIDFKWCGFLIFKDEETIFRESFTDKDFSFVDLELLLTQANEAADRLNKS